jgi:hypothetical protein
MNLHASITSSCSVDAVKLAPPVDLPTPLKLNLCVCIQYMILCVCIQYMILCVCIHDGSVSMPASSCLYACTRFYAMHVHAWVTHMNMKWEENCVFMAPHMRVAVHNPSFCSSHACMHGIHNRSHLQTVNPCTTKACRRDITTWSSMHPPSLPHLDQRSKKNTKSHYKIIHTRLGWQECFCCFIFQKRIDRPGLRQRRLTGGTPPLHSPLCLVLLLLLARHHLRL